MPYCSSVAKFASLDEPQVEIDDEHIEEMTATFETRITRPCSECGDESAVYETTLETEFSHECQEHEVAEDEDEEETPTFEILESEGSCDEYMQTHTAKGKPIKPGASDRYRKRLFSVAVVAQLQCERCDMKFEIEANESDIPAGAFHAESH